MSKTRKLATYVRVDGTAYGPNDDVPADVAKQITNPKAWADGSADSDDAGDGAKSYSSMNKGELEAEIAERGLDASGTKPELIAALEADDADA